ncbi:hypothetical protein [Frankia sp. Cr1]|uniref:hypothetical protein n=1 Tax=Frankia sp. Cr1 TaxID=3073931 RepID=UPI002AD310C5|nr:hypothetical protein [Frankia sp. Cr1]
MAETTGAHAPVTLDRDNSTITIYPDARPVDVMRAWAALPDGLGFAEAFGDVEVTLVFRPVDGVVAGPAMPERLPFGSG